MSERVRLRVDKCPGCGERLDLSKVTATQNKREIWQFPIRDNGELDRDNADASDADWPESQDEMPEITCKKCGAQIPVIWEEEPCQTRERAS